MDVLPKIKIVSGKQLVEWACAHFTIVLFPSQFKFDGIFSFLFSKF